MIQLDENDKQRKDKYADVKYIFHEVWNENYEHFDSNWDLNGISFQSNLVKASFHQTNTNNNYTLTFVVQHPDILKDKNHCLYIINNLKKELEKIK